MVSHNEFTECGSDQSLARNAGALASQAYENIPELLSRTRTERQVQQASTTFDSLILTNPYSSQATTSAGRQASKQTMDASVVRPMDAAADPLPAPVAEAPALAPERSPVRVGDATVCGDPQAERTGLREAAQEHLSAERLARFQSDMLEFERRAAAQGIQPREVAETYRAVQRLFQTNGDEPVSTTDRLRLAEQIIHQAAVPTDINQGSHSSCSVASLESMVYTRHPSRAAELVASVATTGQFRPSYPDGERPPSPEPIVRLQPTSLRPDFEARVEPLPDGDRSFASQLFQVTAANVHYAIANAAHGGQVWYVQEEPIPGQSPRDTGERVIDFAQQPPRRLVDRDGNELDSPDLSDSSIVEVANHILGDRNTMFLRHADRNSPKDPDDGQQLISAATPEQMSERLSQLRSQGRFPVVLILDAGHPPFTPEGKPGGGSGAWHVLTITDFDENTGMVSLDNQWGRDEDFTGSRALSVADLLRISGDPNIARPDFEAMERQRQANYEAGRLDHGLELEYLQFERQYHRANVPREVYEQDVARVLANFLHSRGLTTTNGWEQTLSRDDRRRVSRALCQLPPAPGETRDQRGSAILRLANEHLLRMDAPIECQAQ